MYLKNITLKGFKSFAKKTEINLLPGITAIIGPNGSGKSNIIDSLLWVFGVGSTKYLRYKNTTDIIFTGSNVQKESNSATVKITFNNTNSSINSDNPYSNLEEITIARTLLNSGYNEYKINGDVVRLTDVKELLSDSSIGKHSHTIISQGNLDTILNASPMERKEFIEESAGISKHKNRKNKAINKLDRLNDKLDRLNDIQKEFKKRLKPLKKQAAVADYNIKTIKILDKKNLQLLAFNFNNLNNKVKNLQLEKELAKKVAQNINSKLETEKLKKDKLLNDVKSCTKEQNEILNMWLDLSKKAAILNGQKTLIQEKLNFFTLQLPELNDIDSKKQSIINLEKQNLELKKEIESQKNLEQNLHIKITKIKSELKNLMKKYSQNYLSAKEKIDTILKKLHIDTNYIINNKLDSGIYANILPLLKTKAMFEQGINALFMSDIFLLKSSNDIKNLQNLLKNSKLQNDTSVEKTIENFQLELSNLNEKKNRVENTIYKLNNNLSINTIEIENVQKIINNINKKINSTNNLEKLKQDKTDIFNKNKIVEMQIKDTANKKDIIEHNLTNFQKELNYCNDFINKLTVEINQKTNQINNFDPKIEFLNLQINEFINNLTDNYKISIDNLIKNYTIANLDEQILKNEIASLSAQVKKNGEYNPFALEEFNDLNKRSSFLSDQINDISDAKKNIESVIENSDKTANALYFNSFSKINEAFSKFVSKLFIGASGKIIDSIDGIDIFLQPAGKKIRRLSLLSGGEKSLVAICFLFALFKTNPSPFYVMDEVEAALDDVNLNKLLEIIKDLSRNSQILIITHQKKTMEIADYLYGITMNKSGISTVVSQKLIN
jgi:chromosome segregation protein